MKIQRNLRQRMTIEEFADQHDLTMLVDEGERGFTAHFRDSEVKEDVFLEWICGRGGTEDEAIRHYATKISGKLLVLNAGTLDRREIQVPVLT